MLADGSVLYYLDRGGVPEVAVSGEVCVYQLGRCVFSTAEAFGRFPARSVLKPFQFFAGGLPESVWLGKPQYAAACGSLVASENQVVQWSEWDRGRADLIKFLRLPEALPEDSAYRIRLKAESHGKAQRFHNCYAKHSAILDACKFHSWPLEGYLTQSHPYHHALDACLAEMLERKTQTIQYVVDGCQLPSPVLTTAELASLYEQLAGAKADSRLGKIRDLMLEFPEWVGGAGSADTAYMTQHRGRVVAKRGADGLFCIGVSASSGQPATGIALKLHGGYVANHVVLALAPVLSALGVPVVLPPTPGHTVRAAYEVSLEKKSRTTKKIWDISPLLSPKLGLFEGETPFQRSVQLDVEKGDVISLSSFETTSHAGAHADAPSHFAKGAASIEQVPLHRYLGVCQVVEVPNGSGSPQERSIVPEAIDWSSIVAPRVLFKTGSHPDATVFTPGFSSLSKALILALSKRGVCLVGIDTPSIDPADSKTLEAHQATLECEMGILENLRLEAVEPGVYFLSALPLKIAGGDASPVRAVLTEL